MQVHRWGDEVGADLALTTTGAGPYFGATGGFHLGDDDFGAHIGVDVSVGDVTVGAHSSLSVANTSTVIDGVRHVEHIRIRSTGGLVEVPCLL
jgi:hypothetical protein